MALAKEIMTQEVITVQEDTPVSEVGRLLTEKKISGVPVLNTEKELVGIVCESDIIDQTKRVHLPTVVNLMGYIVFLESGKKFEKELKKMIGLMAADIMTRGVKTVNTHVASMTGGKVDLLDVAGLSLLSAGIYQLLKGNFTAPAWYTAFWYAFGLLSKGQSASGDSGE